jgi:hypothetical protein
VWRVAGPNITAITLTASNVPAGATITMTCKGKPKCKFKSKTIKAKSAGKIDLMKALGRKNKRFRAGQSLDVRITLAGWIGKDIVFKFKKGKIPKGATLCIALGASTPSKC